MKLIYIISAFALCSHSLYSQCVDRVWLNPLPSSVLLHDVCFVSDSVVVAVGSSGTILRSADGGTTWQALNQVATVSLVDVCFADSLTGYACGNVALGGQVVKTTDGGLTWDLIMDSDNVSAQSIFFTSPSVGYIGEFERILKTENGGLTWTSMLVASNANFSSISFANPNLGCAVANGRIYRTSNAGVSWSQTLNVTGEIFRDIQMLDETYGFASTLDWTDNFYRTTNGGLNWTLTPTDTNSDLKTFVFDENGIGYANSGINSSWIYKSTDLGITWQSVEYLTSFTAMAANPNGTVIAVGSNSSIMRSTEFANEDTWDQLRQGYTGALNRMDMINDTVGYFVGSSALLKTTDGGQTFTVISQTFPSLLEDMDFGSEQVGVVVNESGYRRRTIDGGFSWQNVTLSSGEDLKAVYMVNDSVGYVCGESGIVQKTVNKAATWVTKSPPSTAMFYEIYFLNADTGFVCGASGAFYKTLDGGNSWSSLITGDVGNLWSIDFVNETTGFLYSSSGQKYRTVDGGDTWTVINIPNTLKKIDYKNQTEGYGIRSSSNALLLTVDGGEHWSTLGTVGAQISDFKLLDNGNILVTGNAGTIVEFSPVLPTPQLSDTVLVCENGFIPALVPTGLTADWSYHWFFDTFSTADTILASSIPQSTTVFLGYSDGECESIRKAVYIDVKDVPSPPLLLNSDTTICANSEIALQAISPLNVVWNNGATGNEIFVNLEEDYFAVADNGACSSIPSDTVSIGLIPVAELPLLTLITSSSCDSSVVAIQSSFNGITKWYDNDQNFISESNTGIFIETFYSPTNIYAKSFAEGQCESEFNSIFVSVTPTPDPPIIIASSEQICSGDSALISVLSSYEVFWQSGETSDSLYVTGGSYSAQLLNEGCLSETTTISIQEILIATPQLSADSFTFCDGGSMVINGDGGLLNWSTGEIAESITVDTTSSITATRVFQNCWSEVSESITITEVNIPAAPDVLVLGFDSCLVSNVELIALTTNSVSWYSESLGLLLEDTNSLVLNDLDQSMFIYANQSNEFGCIGAYREIDLNFYGTPSAPEITSSDTSICEGETVTLSVINSYPLLWSTNDTESSINVTDAGNYFVTYNNSGCISEESTINIVVNALPDEPIIAQSGVSTLVVAAGNFTYSWYLNGVLIENAIENSLVVEEEGTYTVEITSPDGCSISSQEFYFVLNSIDESNLELEMFPNPAYDIINIESNSPVHAVRCYDIMGKLCLDFGYNSGYTNLQISNLEPGVYNFLIDFENGERWMKQVVVK